MTQQEKHYLSAEDHLHKDYIILDDVVCQSHLDRLIMDAFIAGVKWSNDHGNDSSDSGPVSSGTPCTFNIENPPRVEPL